MKSQPRYLPSIQELIIQECLNWHKENKPEAIFTRDDLLMVEPMIKIKKLNILLAWMVAKKELYSQGTTINISHKDSDWVYSFTPIPSDYVYKKKTLKHEFNLPGTLNIS